MKEIKQLKDRLNFADPSKWSVPEWDLWLDYVSDKKQVNESDLQEAVAFINERLGLLSQQLQTLLSIDPVAKTDPVSLAFGQSMSIDLRKVEALQAQSSECVESNFKRTLLTILSEFQSLALKIKQIESAPKDSIKEQPKTLVKEAPKPSHPPKNKKRKSA